MTLKNKTLFDAFNKLRTSLGFAAISEDKSEELSLDVEFMAKAQTAIDASAGLQASVDRLTNELATANGAATTAKADLATEKAAHLVTTGKLTEEKTAHDALKAASAGDTRTTQQKEDELGDEAKKEKAFSRFDKSSERR